MQSPLFKDKFRIESIRLQEWDYSSCGAYYITICTKNREHFFGDVVNGKIKLSNIGKIVLHYWNEIPCHFKNITLDEFVIMPNHVHGIVMIDKSIVETCHGMSLQKHKRKYNRFSKPISGSISMIINHLKSAVKRWCNKNNIHDFQWQPRFYERIIRNEHELNIKRKYIINNPLNWETDQNNTKNHRI